jgi:glutathione S-transferase
MGVTPALRLGGESFQGTPEISRALDRICPEPPLFPAAPARRKRVEEAERFGEEVLQMLARRLTIACFKYAGREFDFAYGTAPSGRVMRSMQLPGAIPYLIFRYGAKDAVVQSDLIALPRILDRIDDWIEAGVLNGEELNAADFQVAPSLQLLMSLEDVAPAIENRPAVELGSRIAPPYPVRTPRVLPPTWLEPLRASSRGSAQRA